MGASQNFCVPKNPQSFFFFQTSSESFSVWFLMDFQISTEALPSSNSAIPLVSGVPALAVEWITWKNRASIFF